MLKETFVYNPCDGTFVRKKTGRVVGTVNSHGYSLILFKGSMQSAHRLAWLYMNGEWPAAEVDHINGQRSDNRWVNLRAATPGQNRQNMGRSSKNTSGHPNVYWRRDRKKWQVQMHLNNRNHFGGRFDKFEDAIHAAKMMKAAMHKFNPEHRT